MRTHILFILVALTLTACASHQNENRAQFVVHPEEHYTRAEVNGSRVR